MCCQVKNWLKQAQPCNVQTPHLHFWFYFGQSVCSSAPKQQRLGMSSILQFSAIPASKTSAHLVFWVMLATWAQVCSNSHVLSMPRWHGPVVEVCRKGQDTFVLSWAPSSSASVAFVVYRCQLRHLKCARTAWSIARFSPWDALERPKAHLHEPTDTC